MEPAGSGLALAGPSAPAAVAALSAAVAPGEILPYAAIEAVAGLQRRTPRWQSAIRRWKRQEWEQHNRAWRPVPGEGYRLLIPDDRVQLALRERKAALRRLRRAFSLLARTDDILLSDRMRALRDEELKLLGPLAEVADAGRRGAVLLSRRLASRRRGPEPQKTS